MLVSHLGDRAKKGDQFAQVLKKSIEDQEGDTESRESGKPTGAITVVLKSLREQMLFDRKVFDVPPGKRIRLIFENTDSMPHNIVIGKPGSLEKMGTAADQMLADHPTAVKLGYVPDIPEVIAATGLVFPGETEALEFTSPDQPGQYDFVCTFPGHWRIMKGIMRVK